MKRPLMILIALILVLSLLAGCDQSLLTSVTTSGSGKTGPTTTATTRPTTDPAIDRTLFAGSGSYESLLKVISEAIASGSYKNNIMTQTFGAPERSSADAGAKSSQIASGGDYSTTNIQVAGVDEADIVKTDGRNIYYVANNRLYILDAGSANPQVIYTKIFDNQVKDGNKVSGESPVEIFLDVTSKRLIVIVNGYLRDLTPVETKPVETKPVETKPIETKPAETKPAETKPMETKPLETRATAIASAAPQPPDAASVTSSSGVSSSGASASGASRTPESGSVDPQPAQDGVSKVDSRMIMPNYNQKQYTITRIYQIDDPKNPKLVRQFTQEGNYMTARLVNGTVYVLSGKYNYRYFIADVPTRENETKTTDILPKTTDDPVTGTWETLPADRIGIVPGADPNAQMIISAISVTQDAKKPELLTLVGTSGVVYASTDNIYLANYQYDYNQKQPELSTSSMKIYRVSIKDGRITANGIGTVPGTIINQFAMDEHNGYFRIATTDSGAFWGRGSTGSSSTVYVLDQNLKIVGQVGKLGPGETIRSVRFMGDRAYVVTFQTTDPLYVLDLKNPASPKVLGELKIPGFSTYLHPYGENLLLGFGFDAVVEGNRAYQTSLKVSLFDISDLAKPKERSTILLGGIGSYTELASNHKALLFSKEKNLIAFPALLTGESGVKTKDGGMLFQGLVIIKVENDSKLVLRGGLTNSKNLKSLTGNGVPYNQITQEDQMALYGYDTITRGLYIGDRLITLSSRLVRQYDLNSLQLLGSATLKGYEAMYGVDVSIPAVREGSGGVD